jgi:YhcH/YjgK/YiaL family protein
MIVGKLTDIVKRGNLDDRLLERLQFLVETDFSSYSAGRYEGDKDWFFLINEYETKSVEECFFEAHKKYLDIQFIIEGKEKFAIDHIDRQDVKEEYDPNRDIMVLEGNVDSIFTMYPGDVMILFPEDSHMPAIKVEEKDKIRKVVLKVAIYN